jgi:hypothetical protein
MFGILLAATPLYAGPIAPSAATPVQHQPTTSVHSNPIYKPSATSTRPKLERVDTPQTATPSTLTLQSGYALSGIESSELVVANGLWPVHQYDATHANLPNGVALIRNANHALEGTDVDRMRVLGDSAGNVYIHYTVRNGGGGHNPHIRKVLPDNKTGFDATFLLEAKAGIAPDGNGGVYVATHKGIAPQGEVWMTLTAHQTIRYDASGAIVWQVAEANAPKPWSSDQQWSTATRSAAGVFVGYGVKVGEQDQTPVLLHRKAADGSKLFARVGLKEPSPAGTSGALGTTALLGRVDRIWAAPDGSAIATVFNNEPGTVIVRVDASGTQTAAFDCAPTSAEVVPHINGSVACVSMPSDGTLKVTHYGVSGGNLKVLGAFTSAPVAGWDFSRLFVTPSGHYFATGSTGTGYAGIALFSPAGVKLRAIKIEGSRGGITGLVADDANWLAMHRDDAQKPGVYRGTWSPGSP